MQNFHCKQIMHHLLLSTEKNKRNRSKLSSPRYLFLYLPDSYKIFHTVSERILTILINIKTYENLKKLV